MTDLNTLKEMLVKTGIPFSEATLNAGHDGEDGTHAVPIKYSVSVEGGFIGFYTKFTFNLSGDLITMGAYE
jgi:hypothetical protein